MSEPTLNVRPSLKELLGLAWPVVFSRSTQVVVGLTRAVMVGKLGESALAATTAGAINAYTVLILAMCTISIISTRIGNLKLTFAERAVYWMLW